LFELGKGDIIQLVAAANSFFRDLDGRFLLLRSDAAQNNRNLQRFLLLGSDATQNGRKPPKIS
jgi:hypothetical protein